MNLKLYISVVGPFQSLYRVVYSPHPLCDTPFVLAESLGLFDLKES